MVREKIIIRTDSSGVIGTGHVMRCLGLAEELRRNDFDAVFVTKRIKGNIAKKIKNNGFKAILLNNCNIKGDLDFLVKTVKKSKAKFVIIDNYTIGYEYEKQLFSDTGVKILSIDGLLRKHFCHILVNPNIHAALSTYKGKADECRKTLLGYRYFILRDAFLKTKKSEPEKNNNFRILVTMGGADPDNLTLGVIKALEAFGDVSLRGDIIIGPANKNVEQIKKYIKKNNLKNFDLYINTGKVPDLIKKCDLCVCSGGVTIGEALFFNKAIIGCILADNQAKAINFLSKKDFIFDAGRIGASTERLKKLLCSLMDNKAAVGKMQKRTKGLVDGLGKKRIVKSIVRLMQR